MTIWGRVACGIRKATRAKAHARFRAPTHTRTHALTNPRAKTHTHTQKYETGYLLLFHCKSGFVNAP